MKREEIRNEKNEELLYILQKDILTLEEACFYLGIKASFMYKLTSKRLIPHSVPNGKLIYFERSELNKWACQNKRLTMEQMEAESKQYLYKSRRQ